MNPNLSELLDQTDRVMSQMGSWRAEPGSYPPPKVHTGVDLGTAYTVLIVLDEHYQPIAGEYQFAQVTRDGLVVGYVVYVVNPEGATGYGQAYSAVHVNDWGEVASKQIQEGTRRFLEAYPAVDPKRVGCIGASYGGFMTLYLTTDGDFYAAAVSHAGISSISSYWGEGNWGYSYGALATADSFPWNRRDIYVERSPLFRADRSKTPTLLSHGASDTNVPAGESESFYTALKLLGTPVELLEVDGQDHWIVEHDKRAVWSPRSIVAWFDRWLKGLPAWWDDLYPKPR